jgi:hypothetical protein
MIPQEVVTGTIMNVTVSTLSQETPSTTTATTTTTIYESFVN